jgi:hypothetical protein
MTIKGIHFVILERETSPALGYRLKLSCYHCFITFYSEQEQVDSKIEVNRSFDRFFPILHPRHEDFYRLTVFQNNDTDIFTEFMLGSEPTVEILTHVRVHGTNEIHWIRGVHRFKEGSIDFRTSSESGFNSHGYLLSSFVSASVQKLSAQLK